MRRQVIGDVHARVAVHDRVGHYVRDRDRGILDRGQDVRILLSGLLQIRLELALSSGLLLDSPLLLLLLPKLVLCLCNEVVIPVLEL